MSLQIWALAPCSFSVLKRITVHEGKKPTHLIKPLNIHELRTAVKYCHVTEHFFRKQLLRYKISNKISLGSVDLSTLASEYPGCISPPLELWCHVRKENIIIIMLLNSVDRGSDIWGMLLRCLSWEPKDAAFLIKRNKRCSLISMILQLKIEDLKMMKLIPNERSACT